MAIGLSVAVADPAIGALTLVGGSARSGRELLRHGAAARDRTGTDRQHPFVAALDRSSEELIERVARHERAMPLSLPGTAGSVRLNLAAWEQAFRTPPMALATMLHRSVSLVHGAEDAWADPDESRLLYEVLRGVGDEPSMELIPGAGHALSEAADATIEAIARDLVDRLQPRDLPPVLVALEEMEP